ncbi:hypothetical protein LHY41_004739 [Salmonella enterica]|nr:hypothetical protein [Salmonella enterica]
MQRRRRCAFIPFPVCIQGVQCTALVPEQLLSLASDSCASGCQSDSGGPFLMYPPDSIESAIVTVTVGFGLTLRSDA